MSSSAAVLDYEDAEDLIGPIDRPYPMQSLVAAAKRITGKSMKRPGNAGAGSKSQAWQEDAWDMYDLVGEQRFLATTLANRLAQARFFVGKLPEDTTEDIIPVEDGEAYETFQSMVGKGAHFTQMVARLGLNLFIPGDGYLLGIPRDAEAAAKVPADNVRQVGISPLGIVQDTDPLAGIDIETLDWQMRSISELNIDEREGKITLHGPGASDNGKKEYAADDVVLIRVWRPHPRHWWQADSPTRSSLPVLRELVGLTMGISAQIDSRLAGAGILWIPQELDAALRAAAGATGEDDESPLTEALMEAMITPISDRSNASAVVPLMPVVPGDWIEKIRYDRFDGALDPEYRALRDEAIRRLALGQDCPPELLLGVAGMNHWGAWLVREDVVTTHLEPPLALICDAITTQFLWPVLELAGVEDFQDFAVWYDVEHLIQRPNKAQDAKDAHKEGVIGDAALRDALGFDERDAPPVDPTDPAISLALDMLRQAPSLAQSPGISMLAEQVRAMLNGEVIPVVTDQQDPAATPAVDADDADVDGEEQPVEGGTPATNDAPAEGPAA